MKTPEQMELSRLHTENGVLRKHTRIGGQWKLAPTKAAAFDTGLQVTDTAYE